MYQIYKNGKLYTNHIESYEEAFGLKMEYQIEDTESVFVIEKMIE